MSANLTIELAVEDHAGALAKFAAALFAERLTTMFVHEHPPTVAEEREFIRGFREQDNAALFVALDGEAVVGMLGFRGHRRAQLRHAGVLGFSVARAHRRRGIASRMFAALFEWADGDPYVWRFECDVFATNEPALSLLAGLGFQTEGTMRAAIEVGGEFIDNHLLALRRAPKPAWRGA